MATSFPQLLRRSKFASHDPLITRVYNSTPSSVYQHGDWGMKFPIHRSKGPKHISVNSLDTGTILGSDWRSAETEARFVENWGRAGRWTTQGESEQLRHERMFEQGLPNGGKRHLAERYAERDLEAENRVAEQKRQKEAALVRIPNVDAMTKKEFERYIATVRRERGQFLATKLEGVRDSPRREAKETVNESNPTLVGLAARGMATSSDPANFQSILTQQEIESTSSDQIHSTTPHEMYGLTYSAPSATVPPVKGRILNKAPVYGPSYRQPSDDNRDLVASIGGITAELSTRNRQTRDAGHQPTDFTRADRTAGESTFNITATKLHTRPTVQYLAQTQRAAQWNNRAGQGRPTYRSGAAQPRPLDTTSFTIKLSDANGDASTLPEAGSKEWVAKEPRSTTFTSNEDLLGLPSGLGSPRSGRSMGHAAQALNNLQARADQQAQEQKLRQSNMSVTQNLINRLKRTTEARATKAE